MPNARIGILGYGVIGRRVADAVRLQDDMQVVGVAGRPASFSLRDAWYNGYAVYLTHPPRADDVALRLGPSAGTLEELLDRVDVLLDCTPAGVPQQYRPIIDGYRHLVTIVQGGESSEECDVSFNSFSNFDHAAGHKRIRVISCSSTATTRLLYVLEHCFGVEHALATIVRRAADPGKPPRLPLNALRPTPGESHHAPDVRTVMPRTPLVSVSVICPTTFGHVIGFHVDLQRRASHQEIAVALDEWPRIIVGSGRRTTAQLAEDARDAARSRHDRPEVYVFADGLQVVDQTLRATIAVHMESITVPETVDCIRAALNLAPDGWASIAMTDRALGIDKPPACYTRAQTVGSPSA